MAQLITPPAAEPITLAEAKTHLRVTHADEDALIGVLISAARMHVERVTGLRLINQTWEQALDAFPDGAIRILLGPLVSITSVEYLDADGAPQSVDPSDLVLDNARRPGWVSTRTEWPEVQKDTFNAVRVRYVLGFGADGASVPADLRAAILLILGDLFENRQAQQEAALVENRTVDALLWPHRLVLP